MLCSNVCCMSQLLSDTATRNIIIQSHACVQLIDLVKSKIGEYADYSLSVYLTLFPHFSVTSQHLLFRNLVRLHHVITLFLQTY